MPGQGWASWPWTADDKRIDELVKAIKQYQEKARGPEPKNNDGREECWWCGGETKTVEAFSSIMNICKKCGK